jgi:hypothetical protein
LRSLHHYVSFSCQLFMHKRTNIKNIHKVCLSIITALLGYHTDLFGQGRRQSNFARYPGMVKIWDRRNISNVPLTLLRSTMMYFIHT